MMKLKDLATASEKEKIKAAADTNTPLDVLELLSQDPNPKVKAGFISNEAVTDEIALQMIKNVLSKKGI